MTSSWYILFLALCIPQLFTFQGEGTIHYRETVKLDVDLPDEMDDAMKALIPTEQKFMKSLYFKDGLSLYKDIDENQENELTRETSSGDGEMQVRMIVARPDNQLYLNWADDEMVNMRDFMGKKFLIRDQIKKLDWKITADQVKILDYVCMKAVLQDSSRSVEAWFTPQIAAPVGPSEFGQLPGAVLRVVLNDGKRQIDAIKVDLNPIAPASITVPAKGKKVSAEEMKKIVDKKLKEMGAERGQTRTTIRIQNN